MKALPDGFTKGNILVKHTSHMTPCMDGHANLMKLDALLLFNRDIQKAGTVNEFEELHELPEQLLHVPAK